MYWILLLLFLLILYVFSQQKEEYQSRDIIGPTSASLYDPTYKPRRCKRKKTTAPGQSRIIDGPSSFHSTETDSPTSFQPPEDDGTHRSDIATKQFSIYFYKPFATLPFPTSPPPQPFLNDFRPFQR